MKPVAIVLGTYNRIACLQRSIASIRAAVGAHPYCIVVCDGDSTDGTQEYLLGCRDVEYLPGGLEGAVLAFNQGFAWAVEENFPYIMHLNDDAEISPGHAVYPIASAIDVLEKNPLVGEVAFELDLRGSWGFETINGVPYANFGVIRREAGMEVARTWDPEGKRWWNPIYRTYGADCEFGARMWQLGWHIHPARGLRVHDENHQDALRTTNNANNKHGDSDLFWSRWRHVELGHHMPPWIMQLLWVERTPPQPPEPPQPPQPHRRPRSGNRGGNCP